MTRSAILRAAMAAVFLLASACTAPRSRTRATTGESPTPTSSVGATVPSDGPSPASSPEASAPRRFTVKSLPSANGLASDMGLSADGRRVVFTTVAGGTHQVYVAETSTLRATIVSQSAAGELANRAAIWPRISTNGRVVTFTSYASNLMPGDQKDTKEFFLADLEANTLEHVLASDASPDMVVDQDSIMPSADGRFVVYGTPELWPAAGDRNLRDIEVLDRETNTRELVSKTIDGERPNSPLFGPRISSDGRTVMFESAASNLVAGDRAGTRDLFVWAGGKTSRIPPGAPKGSWVGEVATSADLRYVVTRAPDASGDLAVSWLDRRSGERRQVALPKDRSTMLGLAVSGGGRYVAFYSGPRRPAGNTCMSGYSYVADVVTGSVQQIAPIGACDDSYDDTHLSFSGDGGTLLFQSDGPKVAVFEG